MSESAAKYPEHAKLRAVRDLSQAIGSFLEWLYQEKNLSLCTMLPTGEFLASYQGPNVLLAEYFEIDPAKLEDEKLAMLESIRESLNDV